MKGSWRGVVPVQGENHEGRSYMLANVGRKTVSFIVFRKVIFWELHRIKTSGLGFL